MKQFEFKFEIGDPIYFTNDIVKDGKIFVYKDVIKSRHFSDDRKDKIIKYNCFSYPDSIPEYKCYGLVYEVIEDVRRQCENYLNKQLSNLLLNSSLSGVESHKNLWDFFNFKEINITSLVKCKGRHDLL